jgi:general stress protein CsbA
MRVNFARLIASVLIVILNAIMASSTNQYLTKNETVMIAWIGFTIGLFLAALSFELKKE